jgi:hypothetical protein
MHKVYRYSYCNAVAADSMHAYGGLFKRREPQDILPVEYSGTGANLNLEREHGPQHRLTIRSYKVTDLNGANVKFAVKKETKVGDKEHHLGSKTLALKANVNVG